jgi:hypothetical protein
MGEPYVQIGKMFYMPQGLVVGDTHLGRERERVPSLCAWMRAVGARLVGVVRVVRSLFSRCVFLYPFTVPTSPFIVQGGPVYKG